MRSIKSKINKNTYVLDDYFAIASVALVVKQKAERISTRPCFVERRRYWGSDFDWKDQRMQYICYFHPLFVAIILRRFSRFVFISNVHRSGSFSWPIRNNNTVCKYLLPTYRQSCLLSPI